MDIESALCGAVVKAVKELYGQDVPAKMIQLQKTKEAFEGNLTLVVFPFLKSSRKKPEDTAQDIGRYLQQNNDTIPSIVIIYQLDILLRQRTRIERFSNEIRC